MSIQSKLFLAFLCASTFLVISMFALVQWSFDRGLLDYVNSRELARQQVIADLLADYYQSRGSLTALRRSPERWDALMDGDLNALSSTESYADRRPPPQRRPPPPPPREGRDDHKHHGDRPPRPKPPPGEGPPRPKANSPLVLLAADKSSIFGELDPRQDHPLLPIEANGQIVGWLGQRPRDDLTADYDVDFLREQRTEFILIGIGMVLMATLLAFPLSRRLVTPIKQLLAATRQLAKGQYQTRLTRPSHDELGQLTDHVNNLAETLQNNETARKRWIADISHELRTPLAIARGELEAMLDGVRPLDHAQVTSAHKEIERLQKLIEDLYQLTNADIGALRYQMGVLDINDVVDDVISALKPSAVEAQLTIQADLPDQNVYVLADDTRLHQLLNNLLVNCIKYTDPGGCIDVRLTAGSDIATLTINDSAPGVPDDALPQLFDHLYRVDSSRNRRTGGSGLGLALCKKIVAAHHGTISASHSPTGGLSIKVVLPLSDTS